MDALDAEELEQLGRLCRKLGLRAAAEGETVPELTVKPSNP